MRKHINSIQLRILIGLMVGIGANQGFALDKSIHCRMKDKTAEPYHSFVLTLLHEGGAALSWYERENVKSMEVEGPFTLEGLQSSDRVNETETSIYVEFAGEGDAGYINLDKDQAGRFSGTITFPNSGPEGISDGETVEIECPFSVTEEVPEHDLRLKVIEVIVAEFDPSVVGDQCVFYTQGTIKRNGEFRTKTLGFVTEVENCEGFADLEVLRGKMANVPKSDLIPLTEPSRLEILSDFRRAEYYKLNLLPYLK